MKYYTRPVFHLQKIGYDWIGDLSQLVSHEKDEDVLNEAIASSYLETYQIPDLSTYQNHPYDDNMQLINNLASLLHYLAGVKPKITKNSLLQLHQGLFSNCSISKQAWIGRFKTSQNYLGDDYTPCSYLQTESEMEAWLQFYNEPVDDIYDGFQRMIFMHVWFERIHPFQDGNGRVGRMLLAYYLKYHKLSGGYLNLFLVSKKIQNNKDKYIQALKSENFQATLQYFMDLIKPDKQVQIVH